MATRRTSSSDELEPNESADSIGAAASDLDNAKSNATIAVPPLSVPEETAMATTTASAAGAAGAACALDNKYFFEDEVFLIDKKGRVKFGLIIDTPDTYSGDEEEGEEALSKGKVRVAWYPGGKENINFESKLGLADRTLMPGDVVRRMVAGRDTQRGYCREISMRADVHILGTKHVIKNVMAERMRLLSKWQCDSAVCLDSWVGSIKDFEDKAILRSASGARIEISSNDYYVFCDYKRSNTFNPHIFYAGNVVVGRLASLENVKLLTPDIPLRRNKSGKPVLERFVVEQVYTETVWVNWQCKALSEEDNIESSMLQQPNPCVTGDDLNRLKCMNLFDSCMLQINDRNFLTYSSCDTLVRKSKWLNDQSIKFQPIFNEQQKQDYQNFFVHSLSGTSNSSHHFEKTRKKMSLHDSDKAGKSKKFSLKVDKMSNSVNKERSLTSDSCSNEIANISTSMNLTVKNSDNSWVTDDEEENSVHQGDKESDSKAGNDVCEEEPNAQLSQDDVSTTTTLSTGSSPSPRCSPKHSSRQVLKKKAHPSIKKTARMGYTGLKSASELMPKDGDELVTEALLVYSKATVVWQDGSIEENIPSTHLYPIHHLDNHEFFPGDFVISGKEGADVSFRDYGVIQTVDHHGRIAHVKWFTTYASADEPKPSYKGESEVSVYDLKDHPDFQYRPGTMVIRVANFVGEDANCTAGQIIDNFIDGRIKVWWVGGHISMCWPQDLFEVGQYDHAEWEHESEDSWETESENSELGGSSSAKLSFEESHILSNIEHVRVAIARLEELFNTSPNLMNPEVMRKLLAVYKGCRGLDRLLNTSFFHEDHFMGLVERVRRGGNQSISERAQDRKNRLFNAVQPSSPPNSKQSIQSQQVCHYQAIVAVNSVQKTNNSNSTHSNKDYAPKVLFNISSTPFKCKSSNSSLSAGGSCANASPSTANNNKRNAATATSDTVKDNSLQVPISQNASTAAQDEKSASAAHLDANNLSVHAEKNQLLNSAMLNIERAFEKTGQLKASSSTIGGVSSQDDSGNYSRNENCDGSSTSYASSSDLTNADANSSSTKVNDDEKSCSSIELNEDANPELVGVRMCTLLKEQLVKCLHDIRELYYKTDNLNMSDVFDVNVSDADLSGPVGEESIDQLFPDHDSASEALALPKSPVTSCPESETETLVSDAATTAVESVETFREPTASIECFQILPVAPKSHKFHLTIFHPTNAKQYFRAIQSEHRMLKNSLPPGVWVRVFEDRMDLLSVMIEGPQNTPYEDGLFFFDIQLGREYPRSPPLCHYVSYCSDRLNPNLYEDGKVCVSLLGTWSGRDTEVWGSKSTLLQVIVSIQGLILVAEPYFNEAGYEKQKGTQEGKENSRMYNEMAIIKIVQATTKLIQQPNEVFYKDVLNHFEKHGYPMYERIKRWMELSKIMAQTTTSAETSQATDNLIDATNKFSAPEFPLLPASRGFCLTLEGLLEAFKSKIDSLCAAAVSAEVPSSK